MRIHYPGTAPAAEPELRKDQFAAIERATAELLNKGRSKSVLLGAGMGSGKTVVTVEVFRKTKPRRALIVGVRDAYSQWAKTFVEQGVRIPLRQIKNSAAGLENLAKLLNGDDGLYYVGLEFLRAQDWEMVSGNPVPISASLRKLKPHLGTHWPAEKKSVQKGTFKKMKPLDILVSDEAHRHSNQKSASIKTMNSLQATSKIALSGTFFGNKFENAWSLCTWLWGKDVIGTKSNFEADWCIRIPVMSKDGRTQLRTKNGFPITKNIGERNPGEYVNTLPCYIFIATPIGPVPKPEVVKCELGKAQKRQYEQMESQSLAWIPSSAGGGSVPLIADLPIVQRTRLRTAALGGMTLVPGATEDDPDSIRFDPGCNSTTLNTAYDVLNRPSWVSKKALILTHSKSFAIEAARRIGQKYEVALKTGDVSENQWATDKARFMLPMSDPDSIQYLVAVISAVGTATDGLQTECSKVLWLSEDENNTNNMQGANRVWRTGVDLADYEAVKIVQRGTITEGILRKNDLHATSTLDSVAGLK